MADTEFQQFARAFGCTDTMAEAIVTRIRQRVGRDVPMYEILGAIKKIAPTRLTTDTIVARLKKVGPVKAPRGAVAPDNDDVSAEDEVQPKTVRVTRVRTARRNGTPSTTQGQISALLATNWDRAKAAGLKPPDLPTDRFIRATQAAVGEPKPSVARILSAVQKLGKRDMLITPNLVADEIIESDEL